MNFNQKTKRLITSLCLLFAVLVAQAQNSTPGTHWEQYQQVTDAGFSPQQLALASEQFKASNGDVLMVVRNGKVVLAHGDITRRYMAHSIRKAFMSALYGIHEQAGSIKLNHSLKTMGIDDIHNLTETEKTATIRDLLSARSGVYLPAAYSPRGMEKRLPERGSHLPGAHWYYNNWDFNTLLTIFEKQTRKGFKDEFQQRISSVIGMEDFRESDIYFRIEKEKSMHPAYLFKMSTRDMARFGQLYLNEGAWGGEQVIPKQWIATSTSIISKDLGSFSNRGGFGYLWWVADEVIGERCYYTSGSGGHRIIVFPESDLVIVHRVNTYEGNKVSGNDLVELVKKILAARTGQPKDNAPTTTLDPGYNLPKTIALDSAVIRSYEGSYKHPFLGYFTVRLEGKETFLDTNIGSFKMFAVDRDLFVPEDLETPMQFVPAPDAASKFTIKPVFGENKQLEKGIMFY
ncbi:MAG: serine hydrolase [Bacteroidota bacterium]